ncbi:MAG: hypothetical protein R2941_13190 [Desulfobacterales bacterium]
MATEKLNALPFPEEGIGFDGSVNKIANIGESDYIRLPVSDFIIGKPKQQSIQPDILSAAEFG